MKNPLSLKAMGSLASATIEKPVAVKARRKQGTEPVALTFKCPRKAYGRLDEIRIRHNLSLQDIQALAMDMWLKSIGDPGLME